MAAKISGEHLLSNMNELGRIVAIVIQSSSSDSILQAKKKNQIVSEIDEFDHRSAAGQNEL